MASWASSPPKTAITTTTASSTGRRRSSKDLPPGIRGATMSNMRGIRFWKNWGLVSRLMLAVGIAIITGGGVQTALLVAEGAAEHSARLKRELNETLIFIAPLIADQALVGEYAVISQLLRNQVQKGEIDSFQRSEERRVGKVMRVQRAA